MTRPVFVPVYEEQESTIRDRVLGRIPDEWRKEPGDFIYDAVAATPLEVQQLEIQQDEVLKSGFAQYAEDDALDSKLAEKGLTRGQATANKRTLTVTADAGVTIPQGYKASAVILDENGNPLEWTTDAAVTFAITEPKAVVITCKTPGTAGNIPTGSQFILLPPIPGVRVIADAGTTTLGADKESNESAWSRYDFAVRNPDTGGNKNDYVRWAQDITGVGKAKCIPRWNGVNTVKVLLVGTDFKPALAAVVADVQTYLDPGSTGLGDGKAPCGAQVTASAADDLPIAITATVTYTAGYDVPTVKAAFNAAVDAYLKTLVFVDNAVVVWAKIGSLLINTPGVSNYSALTINAGSLDISVGATQVATRGAVTI